MYHFASKTLKMILISQYTSDIFHVFGDLLSTNFIQITILWHQNIS